MAEAVLSVPAPAKLNLSLRVLDRRADGMHNIDSVMTLVEMADTVTVSPRTDGKLQRAWTHPQVGENDLCMRAAAMLRQATNSRAGATIAVCKRIPVGSGLGGGSSNAASTLWALNRLWRTRLRRRQLMALGARLGADVPFFLFGRTARARGVGETLCATKPPFLQKHKHYLLVFPAVMSATAAAYAEYENLTLARTKRTMAGALIDNTNSLAGAVFNLHPQIAAAARMLRRRAGEARLSGSGACVFAAFASRRAAEQARQTLPKTARATVTTALAEHPLAANNFCWGVAKW